MQVVSRVVLGARFRGPSRVLDDCCEIQDCVIGAASSDPLVQRLALGLALRGPVCSALERGQRRPVNPQTASVSARDELLVAADELRHAGRRLGATNPDIVDPFQHGK